MNAENQTDDGQRGTETAGAVDRGRHRYFAHMVCAGFLLAAAVLGGYLVHTGQLFPETRVVTYGAWRFEETTARWSFPLIATRLTWNGVDLPASLTANKVRLFTPLGGFMLDGRGNWWRQSFKIPLRAEGQPWVMCTLETKFWSQQVQDQGFYETSALPEKINAGDPWIDTQLDGTPPDWVYVLKTDAKGYRGYWASPEKLSSLVWE